MTTVNSEICRENFFFVNSVKRHICDVKNSRLGHDLTISVNNRVILPFHEVFIFICEVSQKQTLAKICEFIVSASVLIPGMMGMGQMMMAMPGGGMGPMMMPMPMGGNFIMIPLFKPIYYYKSFSNTVNFS